MQIELTNEQLLLLRTIVEEYTDSTYSAILDYQKCAQAAEEEIIRQTYLGYAEQEEKRYHEARALRGYLAQYEVERPRK